MQIVWKPHIDELDQLVRKALQSFEKKHGRWLPWPARVTTGEWFNFQVDRQTFKWHTRHASIAVDLLGNVFVSNAFLKDNLASTGRHITVNERI